MKKVVLLEPVLAHYRKDLYEHYMNCKDFDFNIIGGNDYINIHSIQDKRFVTLNYLSFNLSLHRFYYLKGSLKYIFKQKPDIIICSGVDFHHIHTLILFFLYRIIMQKEFYWWSHANFGTQGKFGKLVRALFYRPSSGIFAYSNKGKQNLLSMGVKEYKIQVINNAINYEDYGYLNGDIFTPKLQNDIFTILYSGRITKNKELDILFRALGVLKQKNYFLFKCYIIGDGNTDSLKILAEELRISDIIEFTGSKYGKDAFPYFLQSDIFIYPGGIGLSLLHALSFGLPVITTDDYLKHFPEVELLIPGKNGDLYKDSSCEDLVLKILEWKEKLGDSRDEIRRNCVNIIDEFGYLPEKVSNTVINYLNKRYINLNEK